MPHDRPRCESPAPAHDLARSGDPRHGALRTPTRYVQSCNHPPIGPLAQQVRLSILDQAKRANVGHIGSALSIADILVAHFDGVINCDPGDPERDRFVLSKGHAALALYATLHATGRLSSNELDEYCTDGTRLGAHPEHSLAGIDFSTGSLGHGLSYAAGAALAARIQRSPRRAFAVLSDAECNEGSVWEAAMFAAHHRLGNLVVTIDVNRQQALGYTRDVLDLDPLAQRWQAFGWDVHECDGHDVTELTAVLAGLDTTDGAPHVVLAATTFGKGVSFMENQIAWHYWPMNDDQYGQAVAEVTA